MSKPPFIRVDWKEARQMLKEALQEKYSTMGEIILMKDYGYGDVSQLYDEPSFIDIQMSS